MSRKEHPDGKEPIWENPTLINYDGKGNFQLLRTGMVPSFDESYNVCESVLNYILQLCSWLDFVLITINMVSRPKMCVGQTFRRIHGVKSIS